MLDAVDLVLEGAARFDANNLIGRGDLLPERQRWVDAEELRHLVDNLLERRGRAHFVGLQERKGRVAREMMSSACNAACSVGYAFLLTRKGRSGVADLAVRGTAPGQTSGGTSEARMP